MTPDLPSEKGRVSILDTVRAVAVLGVIAAHSLSASVSVTQSSSLPKSIFMLFDYGQFGVQVFFSLSGWLIFSLYYRNSSQIKSSHYWARRVARIWPLWAVFILIYFAIYPIDTGGLPAWFAIILSLLFLGWTVGTLVGVPTGGLTIQQEMGHYAMFWLFRKRGVDFFLTSVILGYATFFLARWIVSLPTSGEYVQGAMTAWLRLSLFTSWPFFVFGGLTYLAFTALSLKPSTGRIVFSYRTGVLLLIVLIFGSQILYAQETPSYFVAGFVALSIFLGIAIDRIPRLNAVFWSIGRYSYFMYFFHFLVLRQLEVVYRHIFGSEPSTSPLWNILVLVGMFLVSTAISWSVAWISWRIFENPILRTARAKYQ